MPTKNGPAEIAAMKCDGQKPPDENSWYSGNGNNRHVHQLLA